LVLKNLFYDFLTACKESEEEPRKSYSGIIIDDDGEEVFDELAYLTYWDGLDQEL